ncbi:MULTISPECIES: universal stress protein [Olivibacter]|uniref:Universal stress protein n=1 Tax=Olivibacter jilunii TaxID=985016 RepID=A0ABW6B2T3_9SPHI|nr:universal stress protein [Olivibacter sp. UJ_SKK_5.1]MDX3916681.1 universal stress protein [Pseudosphingobacterium sp.]
MRTIIVATDFSDIAENAVEYAATGASIIDAKIVLFNAFKLPLHASNTILSVENVQSMIDKNKLKLETRANDLIKRYDIEVAVDSSLLNVEDEVERLMKQYDAEMVIMGMAKRSLEQDLLGNTTTNVIQKLKFPVLAVPEGVTFKPVKRILYACDVVRGIHKTILERIKDIARSWNAEIEVFNVQEKIEELHEDPSFTKDPLKDEMTGIQYFYKNVASNTIIKEIRNEVENFQPDLLIMVPNRYGFWSSIVHRSKTRMMAAGLDVPLLSIPI